MYVSTTLKCPDEGSWIALTLVTADGETERIGYLSKLGGHDAAQIDEVGTDSWGRVVVRLRPDATKVNVTINTVPIPNDPTPSAE